MGQWDYLIIAAGSNYQAKAFEIQLERLKGKILEYVKNYYVQVDKFPGLGELLLMHSKFILNIVGPGLATAHIISRLMREQDTLDNLKILVIHCGGFSKRLPHEAPFGKLFTYLPDGACILEHKLKTYR